MAFGVLYSSENINIYKNSYMLILNMFPQVTLKKPLKLLAVISPSNEDLRDAICSPLCLLERMGVAFPTYPTNILWSQEGPSNSAVSMVY